MLDISAYMSKAYFVSCYGRKIENSDKSIWISHYYIHKYVCVSARAPANIRAAWKSRKICNSTMSGISERKISPNSTFGLTNFYKIFNSDILSWCAAFFSSLLKYNFIIQWACFSFSSLLQLHFHITAHIKHFIVLYFCRARRFRCVVVMCSIIVYRV